MVLLDYFDDVEESVQGVFLMLPLSIFSVGALVFASMQISAVFVDDSTFLNSVCSNDGQLSVHTVVEAGVTPPGHGALTVASCQAQGLKWVDHTSYTVTWVVSFVWLALALMKWLLDPKSDRYCHSRFEDYP